jgi:hypothetical protein
MPSDRPDASVWYACYGANLLRERFMAYLRGGRVPGTEVQEVGSLDATPPARDQGILILHPLMFAGASVRWGGGGVAVVGEQMDASAKTLGRMYLVTRQQFSDVLCQENGLGGRDSDLGLDLDEVIHRGRASYGGGFYNTVLHLGEEGGYPIFTFTAAWTPGVAPIRPPSPRYVGVLAQGLRETYALSTEGIVEYLGALPGIAGAYAPEDLFRIAGDSVPPGPGSFS